MVNENIAKALVAVQGELNNPNNTATNPFFKNKYAPLPHILNVVRPVLTKHGIALIQNTGSTDDGLIFVQTILIHESGEAIESAKLALKPDKNNVQGAGSVVTYGRRYQISALLGIASEDDDDGNTAVNNGGKVTGSSRVNRPKPAQKAKPKPANKKVKPVNKPAKAKKSEVPTDEQLEAEEAIANEVMAKLPTKPKSKKNLVPANY